MELMVFPIIKALYYSDGKELHKIVGTGFYIDANGMFLTARHVFTGPGSAFDLEGASGYAVYCVHSVHIRRKPVARHIDVESITLRNDTDIAAGRVKKNQFARGNPAITSAELENTAHFNHLTTDPIPIGTKIWTVAYPLATVSHSSKNAINIHSQSDMFTGKITAHYPVRRDRGLLNWPCYETDMELKAGASGGPVFVSGSGVIFAVNCTGTEPHSVSHVSSLAPLTLGKSTHSPDTTK
jgi:Trypsin-like peptidase domain